WEEAAWLLVGGPRPPLAGAGPAREPVQTTPRRTRRLRDRLRVLARDDRRPLACRLRRAARRSQRTRRDRVPPARAHLVWRARRAGACADERQRLLLRRRRFRPHPRPARDPTSPHAPVPAPHKRQSRTPHPNAAERMALRPRLRQQRRARSRPPALPHPLQLPTTPRQPRPPTTGLETEQPRQELQLAGRYFPWPPGPVWSWF